MLDLFLQEVAALLLLLSVFKREAFVPALIVSAWLIVNTWLLGIVDTYSAKALNQSMKEWAIIFAAKDGLLLFILAIRQKSKELPLIWSFSVSCLLHQVITVEIYNKDLTLFYFRPDIMEFVTASMLASVIYILLKGDGINGGKRVKSRLFFANNRLHSLFHLQTLKVKK